MIGNRLSRLADALGDKSYLDGDAFTAGDLMMTSVLRSLDGKDLIERHPTSSPTRRAARRGRPSRRPSPHSLPILNAARRSPPETLKAKEKAMSYIDGFVAAAPAAAVH
jgi:glutathione S-transferase